MCVLLLPSSSSVGLISFSEGLAYMFETLLPLDWNLVSPEFSLSAGSSWPGLLSPLQDAPEDTDLLVLIPAQQGEEQKPVEHEPCSQPLSKLP